MLWLFRDGGDFGEGVDDGGEEEGEREWITEAGTMNLFIVLKRRDERNGNVWNELITPPLDGTILPGVTRDCVLSLARERLVPQGWKVSERRISMGEVARAAERGDLVEVFGTGTAAVVSPVGEIRWKGRVVKCQGEKQGMGEVTGNMKSWIEERQYGRVDSTWSVCALDILRRKD